jgi:thiol-disulfide isomerase/thioredoxin
LGVVLPIVAFAGLLIGAAFVYGTGGFERKAAGEAGGQCAASLATAERLGPLMTGEVAALMQAKAPMSLADLAFTAPDGKPMTLADRKGKVLLVNLWATWCAPCRKEMPDLDALQKSHGGDQFEVVAINIDTRNPDKAEAFLKEIGVERLARYADPTLSVFNTLKSRGRAIGLPVTVLIDRQGCELGTMNGPAMWASPDAHRLIEAAVAAPSAKLQEATPQ